MKKYCITIVVKETGCVSSFVRDEEDIDSCVDKELGGWNNIQHYASTAPVKGNSQDEYTMVGCTKDNSKAFCISRLE